MLAFILVIHRIIAGLCTKFSLEDTSVVSKFKLGLL
jgi:hypothetical protein